ALSLLTHSAADPSFNTATPDMARNLLGVWGAKISDLLMQGLGMASAGLVLILAAWGWRIFSHQGLPHIWINLLMTVPALVALALLCAALPVPGDWPYAVGLGGLAGDGLMATVRALPELVDFDPPLALIAFLAILLTLTSFIFALGISRAEYVFVGQWLIYGVQMLVYVGEQVGTVVLARVSDKWAARREERALAREKAPVAEPRLRPRRKVTDDTEAEADDEPKVLKRSAAKPTNPAETKRVARTRKAAKPSKRAAAEQEPQLNLGDKDGYRFPPLSILSAPEGTSAVDKLSDEALEQNARMLESVLDDFGVKGEITEVRPGPVVTLYELTPAPGIKSSRVIGLADDIARSMSAISARVAVVPGRNAIGIELPNQTRETVYLRELFSSSDYESKKSKLTLALGKDIGGASMMADLSRMPHLLIAGTTGSGKSVAINTMILSLLYRLTPDQCRFIMIDPKMLELSVYDDIPHLLSPVVIDPKKAVVALKWTVKEMEDRYRKMSKMGVRNVNGYNQRIAEAHAKGEVLTRKVQTGYDDEGHPIHEEEPLAMEALPYIVVIVDEMADLMMVAGKDVEGSIQRLAQMARAAGIHLIMATQRPSVDVITGTIKANFPTRISFQVTSKIDSRTILGEQGAEQLLGMGDMLYMAGGGRIARLHGPFVTDEEVEEVVDHLKKQGKPVYVESVTEDPEGELDAILGIGSDSPGGGSGDDLFDQAVAIVARDRKASTSYIQRKLQIGYNRAARLIEQMEEEGMISGPNHVGRREVLLPDHGEEM
ncbi:MAG: DNA translocase FtsK 4TM domain-containing protein, partial [Alphaproteobacteria bacterium]